MPTLVRCVQYAPITVSYLSVDADGEPSGDDPGTVTVGVVRADGTVVVASGAATSGSGAAARTYTVAATGTALLDELTVTWTASEATVHTTIVEVVGGVLATTAEIRVGEPSLNQVNEHSAALILRARAEVTDLFERACGHVLSFVPRFATATVHHVSGPLVVPHYFLRSVRWVRYTDSSGTVTSVDISAGVDVDDAGQAWLRSGWWPCGRLLVGYEHGYDAPPADVKRQAIFAIRRMANQSRNATDPRATTQTLPGGEVLRFPTPGLGPWVTGIPEIDELLNDYRKRFPVAAIA